MQPGSTVPWDDVCLKRASSTDCDSNLGHLTVYHIIYSLGHFLLVGELGCQKEEKNLLQLCPPPQQHASPRALRSRTPGHVSTGHIVLERVQVRVSCCVYQGALFKPQRGGE